MKDLVEKYIALRDAKAALAKKFKENVAVLDAPMEKIEAMILKEFGKQGIESARTDSGTAYKSVRTSATVADWEAILGYIVENRAWEMLERRVSKEAVVAFREEHDDLPPGVNYREEITLNVRRS